MSRRTIYLNVAQCEKFCSNRISTSKYNVLNFLPKFLYEQFRKYANIFFLLIALLQQIPNISPTGKYTTALPLFIILCCSAIKEIVEDFKRYIQDESINKRQALVLRMGKWLYCKWTDVRVGDIVKVVENEFFPADLLLMSTSEPQGICYIETSNLDGETNLKIRKSPPYLCDISSSSKLRKLAAYIEAEAPNRHLHEFNGSLTFPNEDKTIPLGTDYMLLRGSQLRNTKWIFGTVIYTGKETKLMMNSSVVPFKRSNVEKITNKQILWMFVFLLGVSFVSSIANQRWKLDLHWYSYTGDTSFAENFGLSFLTFVIMYNNLIPISLQVTLELVKFCQATLINWDIDMYDEESDTPAMARTSNLNEELGQVRFIFSDKTGTLTMNVMEFKQCSIGGRKYTEDEFYGDVFQDKLRSKEGEGYVKNFLVGISTCHTVVPTSRFPVEDEVDTPKNKDLTQYNASSPDEFALLTALKKINIVLLERTPYKLTVRFFNRLVSFKVLNLIEFTSARKMMSVIVEDESGQLLLFCKGADDVIFQKLRNDCQFQAATESHLIEFAASGLRTLCMAFRKLGREEYKSWNEKHTEAACALDDREIKIEKVAKLIEKDLILLGATGIEDKLQAGVPETVSTLHKAGIKLWILTGDKLETAINIGYSCKLLSDDMLIITFDSEDMEDFRNALSDAIAAMSEGALGGEFAMVLNGKSLELALSERFRVDFVHVALNSKTVICCRSSPLQKAKIVELVKEFTKHITLAIGDGANDVGMIQAAHVGIGINGKEGIQAACASDYSIAQFRFLCKLLLVHGVWNYRRLCKVILYSFYKNICLYIIELWFAFFSAFSGQVLFEKWTLGLYNVIFTAAPPLALGIVDRCLSANIMLKFPSLYEATLSRTEFNDRVFWQWIITSVFHSLILFFMAYGIVRQDVVAANGRTYGSHLFVGCYVYTYVVVVVCIKAGLISDSWTFLTHIAIWGSVFAWMVFLPVYSHLWPRVPVAADMVGMGREVYAAPSFWFGFILIPFCTLFLDIVMKAAQRTCCPTLFDDIHAKEFSSIDPTELLLSKSKTFEKMTRGFAAIKTVFKKRKSTTFGQRGSYRGFAFSQEEDGVVSQSQVILPHAQSNNIDSPDKNHASGEEDDNIDDDDDNEDEEEDE